MTVRVAILGATGLVGRTLLTLLEERRFPVAAPILLASDQSAARQMPFRGGMLPVHAVRAESFANVDIALFASGNDVSERWAPVAAESGAITIDNSSAFRYHLGIPLVVPEINGDLLELRPPLIANPNCSTIAIVMALAPLLKLAVLERVVVSTYQSVSGGGLQPMQDLETGVRAGLDGMPPPRAGGLPPFAFNVVPHIDRFESNGYSREEMKVVWETRKILDRPELPVSATAVRVPVRVGHCAAVNAVFASAVSPEEARRAWDSMPGVRVVDDPQTARYPTPLEVAGQDDVFVGRARSDVSHPRGLDFFVCSDNLRKGAALNAIQIAERLLRVGAGAP